MKGREYPERYTPFNGCRGFKCATKGNVYMNRQRAQSIIIQDGKVLFGVGLLREGYIGHFFIGGGVDQGETPEEAAIRELREEANVEGKIIFKFKSDVLVDHHTYLVDIDRQVHILGFDPEEEEQMKNHSTKMLQSLELLSLNDNEKFTSFDIKYFEMLIYECRMRNYYPAWIKSLEEAVKNYYSREIGIRANP